MQRIITAERVTTDRLDHPPARTGYFITRGPGPVKLTSRQPTTADVSLLMNIVSRSLPAGHTSPSMKIDSHPLITCYATDSRRPIIARTHQARLIENTRSIHCCQCPAHLGTGLYDCEGWPGGISTSVPDGNAVYSGSRTRDLVPADSTRSP